jgi:hypothetical protein
MQCMVLQCQLNWRVATGHSFKPVQSVQVPRMAAAVIFVVFAAIGIGSTFSAFLGCLSMGRHSIRAQ